MPITDCPLDGETCAAAIDLLLDLLPTWYVDPAIAQTITDAVRQRSTDGAYSTITSSVALCTTLTTELQALSQDKHLFLLFSPEPHPLGELPPASAAERADAYATQAIQNFGIQTLQRLTGNVGYLDLRAFVEPDYVGDLFAAVMALIANTDALILDFRQHHGGYAATVALFASYFFRDSVELSSVSWRAEDRLRQWHTSSYVPGPRYVPQPVYILIGPETFSAAEAFTYDLQHHKRAIIIGERSGGGAHLPKGFYLTPHISIAIPAGRAINPLTKANWEGAGVEPDIAVPQEQALEVAHREALRQIIEHGVRRATGPRTAVLAEAQQTLEQLESTERAQT